MTRPDAPGSTGDGLRRRSRVRLVDVPRLLVGGVVQLGALFGGRYQRVEGAHVLVEDAEGRILVVSSTYMGPGWMLPGGRVERGETPEAAAERETREETGLEVAVNRLLLVEAYRPKDVSFVFGGRLVGGVLDPQVGEIAEVGWLTREELSDTSPRLHRLLQMIDAAGDGIAYRGPPG
jgi:ADP-ribose pyrophosphatase YjhB (NUDIX family)